MATFYNYVTDIRTICSNHPQVAANYYGDNIQIDSESKNLYPAIVVEPAPANIVNGAIDYVINIVCVDLMNIDRSEDLETDSKIIQILTDVIGDIKMNEAFKEFSIDPDITLSPIDPSPEFNDSLLGWSVQITATAKLQKTGCNTNIINNNSGIGAMAVGTTLIVE